MSLVRLGIGGYLMLLLATAASAADDPPRPWPLRTISRIDLTPNAVIVLHRTRVFGRVVNYYPGCRGPVIRKFWGWKTKRSRLVVRRADGKRLTARRYDQILLTADGRMVGLRFAGPRRQRKGKAEYLSETGLRTPLDDSQTGSRLSVIRWIDFRGKLIEYQTAQDLWY
jgi:hypothetical protein